MMAKPWQKKLQRLPVLPDDILVEIFSRMPYRSLCRFKCVSPSWRTLCSDPELRKKAAQTLSGFFFFRRDHCDKSSHLLLLNMSGRVQPLLDPPLPFLSHYGDFRLHSSCNGLLLCQCWGRPRRFLDFDYIVCNPATKTWIVLPPDERTLWGCMEAVRLGFDPAVSVHFKVFMFLPGSDVIRSVTAVLIFSSESGDWAYRESGLGDDSRIQVPYNSKEVFFNGTLHITTPGSSIVTVDSEGKTWRNIPTPCKMYSDCSSIGHSQGRLYITHVDSTDCQLSVWVLEDYDSARWTLKHTVCILRLHGRNKRRPDEFYDVIVIHPEHNLVFIIGRTMQQNCLLAYDMDRQKINFICSLDGYSTSPATPYIPYFGEWLSVECYRRRITFAEFPKPTTRVL
ncbi:hypothetical protein ACP70R_003790 [Stipagrostis hirtigluma subsp. patula]